jgi:FkbM family methyltransferase
MFRNFLGRFVEPYQISRIKTLIPFSHRVSKFLRLEFFGLNGIDRKVDSILNKCSGFYVELGANDGVNQSNTLFFERFKNWNGVLIEPHPQTFERLKRNRSDRNFFKHAACVSSEFERNSVEMAFSHLMTTTLEVETDLEDQNMHAQKGSRFWRGQVYNFFAPALTLSEILDEAKAPYRIDFLSLDVEGAELEVLKGLDHKKYRFGLICIESRDYLRINEYLMTYEYHLLMKISSHDYLFKDCS